MFRTEIVSNTLNMHYTLQNPQEYGIQNYPVTYGNDQPFSLVMSASPSIHDYQHILHNISYQNLNSQDQLTYDILSLYLENEKNSDHFLLYSEPLGAATGIQAQLPVLLAEYAFYNPHDIDIYLKLISQTDQYFSSLLEFEQNKSAAGLFMHSNNAEAILQQCQSFLLIPEEENFLLTIFEEKIQHCDFLSHSEKASYIAQNRASVLNHVMPAYQLLFDGLSALTGTCRNPGGLCHFPQGKSYYEYLIRSTVGSYLPIAGIEKRIRLQLADDLNACRELLIKYAGTSLNNPFLTLESDPGTILQELQTLMQKDFPAPPDVTCHVKYVHDSLADYLSPAFYLTPPIDNLTNHTIYINPSSDHDPLELYTTLAHEGYPGHLYQNLSFAQSDTPVRSLLNFGGYTEGWATYVEMESYHYAAETLIANLTADSPFTEQTITDLTELQRRNRCAMLGISSLLDICIHYHGFSLEDTSEFLENLGFSNSETASSIYYAVVESPANYLKYYLGYLTFLDLRTWFSQNFADAFDLKDFHKQILSIGPCQFPVLEKYLKSHYE